MTGIDNMLSQYIKVSLESQIGKKATLKIEQQLDLWYQISLDEAVTQFEKLDRVLTDIYGKNPAKSLEKRFLKSIIDTKNISVNNNNDDNKSTDNNTSCKITITEPELIKTIMSMVGDESFRKIFDAINGNEMGILEILRVANLDLSDKTKYRKIDELIKSGLIVESGYVMGNMGRRVKAYKKIFDALDVTLNDDAIQVTMTVNIQSTLKNSVIINSAFGI